MDLEQIKQVKRARQEKLQALLVAGCPDAHGVYVDHPDELTAGMLPAIVLRAGDEQVQTDGLGLGGEGYLSFSIAGPTGEGVTTPLTFTRERRCTMVDDLCIL